MTEKRREGSRWYGGRPTEQELAEWFSTVKLHEGMRHEDYLGGIALLEQTEVAHREVNDRLVTTERLVYVAYPRVETRIKYFWDLMELRSTRGEIEPVGSGEHNLPPGFFLIEVDEANGRKVTLVGRTMRVVYEHPQHEGVILRFPPEARTVSLLRNGLVDPDAFAKASTGAVGRALGAAGILVLPGAGVATAEDIPDAAPATPQEGGERATAAPPKPHEEVLAELVPKVQWLQNSDLAEEFATWWSSRHLPPIAALTPVQAKAVGRKVTKMLEAAIPNP